MPSDIRLCLTYYNLGGYGYLRCRQRVNDKSCEGTGTIRSEEMERVVYDLMMQKMRVFQSVNGMDAPKQSPELIALRVDLARVESDIEKLLTHLWGICSISRGDQFCTKTKPKD